jgi:hypothetical protein
VPSGNSSSRASVGCKLAQIVRSLVVDGVWFVHLPSFARPSISEVTDRRCWRARLGAVRVSCTAKFSGRSRATFHGFLERLLGRPVDEAVARCAERDVLLVH